MLEVADISKNFGEIEALKDVSFEIQPGEIYSLIGPNGSGKTTLTKIVAGLLQPSAGTATIASADITQEPLDAKAATAYIPDNPTAWGQMTGREFLDFVGVLYGMAEDERTDRIVELLPTFNLGGIADTLFSNYSRGNRQKFSILAAFLHNPKLILVDEPIVGLDQDSVKTMKKLFADFAGAGGSILITTHTLPVAEDISDRFGMLRDGSLIASGTLEELRQETDSNKNSLSDIYTDIMKYNQTEDAYISL